jgi:hypothetical protein
VNLSEVWGLEIQLLDLQLKRPTLEWAQSGPLGCISGGSSFLQNDSARLENGEGGEYSYAASFSPHNDSLGRIQRGEC